MVLILLSISVILTLVASHYQVKSLDIRIKLLELRLDALIGIRRTPSLDDPP